MSVSGGWPTPLVGSMVTTQNVGTNQRLVRVDADGHLQVDAALIGVSDVNLAQVAGTNTVEAGINGVQAIGGPEAMDAPATVNPVLGGAIYEAARTSVQDGDMHALHVTADGQLLTESDIARIGGNTVASVGVNGGFFVGGDVAHDAAITASFPVKVGGKAVQVPAAVADGDMSHVTLDLEGFLRVVSKAFSELSGADQVENLNTDGTDHGYFLIANETNITQPATQYFPNSSGIEIGSRVNITILLLLEDITSVAFEFTNDPTLTSWEDITASIMDPNTGANLYASTHWTEPGSGTPIVMAMHIRGLNAGSFRLAVVGSAAANTFAAHGYSGAL